MTYGFIRNTNLDIYFVKDLPILTCHFKSLYSSLLLRLLNLLIIVPFRPADSHAVKVDILKLATYFMFV